MSYDFLTLTYYVFSEIGSQKFHKYSQKKTLKWLKKKVYCFLFCFKNCFMFKMKMLINLSIFASEPCGVPKFKVCVLCRKESHHSEIVALVNVMRY